MDNHKILIKITPNNIFVIVSDQNFKILFYISSGQLKPKFKGRKKISKTAARLIALQVIRKLKTKKKKTALNIYFVGNVKLRRNMLEEFSKANISIKSISDITPTPHNGCRLKKQKR